MAKSIRRTRAGNPPTDIAWRLRNWVWYWQVKEATGLSDEALDTAYLSPPSSEGNRRRFFHRVRTLGSDPTLPRPDLDDRSVFENVHAQGSDPQLQIARRAFDSPLWLMLSSRSWGVEDDRLYIAETIADRGWYRLQPEDRELAIEFIRDEPALGQCEDREHVYSTMLTHLESHASADHIALLAALYREALNEVSLEQAIQLRSSLRACTGHWVRHLAIPEDIARLIERLVDTRLARNIWTTIEFPRGQFSTQQQYVRALVKAHLEEQPTIDGSRLSMYPIVLPSPRLAWLKAHKEALLQEHFHVLATRVDRELQQMGLSGIRDEVISKLGAAALVASPSAVGLVAPPRRDTRYCLPVHPGRGMRSGNRVAPYLVDGVLDTSVGRRMAAAKLAIWRHGDPPPPLDATRWEQGLSISKREVG